MKILTVVDSDLIGEILACVLKKSDLTINDAAMGLAKILSLNDFDLEWSNNGKSAIDSMVQSSPDALLIDLSVTGFDAMDFIKLVSRGFPHLPILAIVARDTMTQSTHCKQLGVEEFIRRPFDIQDLVTRLQGLQRRNGLKPDSELRLGPVVLDTNNQILRCYAQQSALCRREYLLLKSLMSAPGKVHSRHSLEIRLYRWDEELASNAIDVHIHKLRKKLPPQFIQTVRGIGYTVCADTLHSTATIRPQMAACSN